MKDTSMDHGIHQYELLYNRLKEIKAEKLDVLIHGTSRAAWYVLTVLEHFDIQVKGKMDNDPQAWVKSKHCPIGSPEYMSGKYPGAVVFVAIFNEITATEVEKQLEKYCFSSIYVCMEIMIFAYFKTVVRRQCNETVLYAEIKKLFKSYTDKNLYRLSPKTAVHITSFCSLKCKECCQHIPYYDHPQHYQVEDIVTAVNHYAEAFDLVPELTLQGGEPFLHPKFDVICEELSKNPKIIFLNVMSNSTIFPEENQLIRLSKSGAFVYLSDYGKLSSKRMELEKNLLKKNIYVDNYCSREDKRWSKSARFTKIDNSNNELLNAKFNNCISGSAACASISNGKLFRCAIAPYIYHHNLIKNCNDDYVDLLDSDVSTESMKASIWYYLSRANALNTCRVCNLPESSESFPPAVQASIKDVHYFKEHRVHP